MRACSRAFGSTTSRETKYKNFPPLCARYSVARATSRVRLRSFWRDFTAVMVKGMPVETVWIGRLSSKSEGFRLVNPAMDSAEWVAPNVGFFCVISPNIGSPSDCSKRTGTVPTLSSKRTSLAPVCRCNTYAVPSVGCPAKGSSSWTVKIRTRTPRSFSAAVTAVAFSTS